MSNLQQGPPPPLMGRARAKNIVAEEDGRRVSMTFQKTTVALTATLIISLLTCSDIFAAETSLRVAYAAFTSNNLPLWVSKEKGVFKSEGLDIDVSYGRGGSSTAQALLAKSIDIMIGSGGAVEANLAGADVIYIASHVPTLVLTMFAKPEIKRVSDLKGKSIGTTAPASITEYAVRLTLKRYGLDPYKDINVVHTNGMENTFAALSQGLVDAGIFSGPIVMTARKSGYRELVNIASLSLPFVHEGVVVRRSYLGGEQGAIEKIPKGIRAGHSIDKRRQNPRFQNDREVSSI